MEVYPMRKLRASLLILILALPMLPACGLGGGAQPAPSVAVSEEAATSLEQKLGEAAQSQEPKVTLNVTQEEITSYLRLRVKDSPLLNPQVVFQPGQIVLTGQATAGVTQELRVVAAPRVENGILQFEFREAKFGPLPLPTELLSVVNDELRRVLVGNTIGRLDTVEVGNGTLTVTGERAS
jgi:hypothetical protein